MAERPTGRPVRGRWETAASFDEAFGIAATNVRSALDDLPSGAIMITSARPGEGKTVVSVELALALAAQDLRVVIADLNLRRPAVHRMLGVAGDLGLADVVQGRARLDASLTRVNGPLRRGSGERGLYVLPAGVPVNEPEDVLSRPRTGRILEKLSADADVLLLDCPPVLPVADALTIGRLVGAALLVVDPRRTGAGPVERARDLLRRNGTQIVGLLVNQVRGTDAGGMERYGINAAG